MQLFQSVQLFCSVVLNSSGIDYHVVLAQNAFQQCLNSPELQPELLAILAKQTGRQAVNRHGVQVCRFLDKADQTTETSTDTVSRYVGFWTRQTRRQDVKGVQVQCLGKAD